MRIETTRLMNGTLVGCVRIEEKDDFTANELMELCAFNDAALEGEYGEDFVVGFPGLACQIYSKRALLREPSLRKK